jgi:hypothetical protein
MIGGKPLFAFIGGGTAGAAQALTSTGDIHTFTIPFKCKPIRAGVTLTTTVSSSVSAVVKFDRRPTAGLDDASRGDGDVGTLTIPTAAAAGKAYYENTNYVDAGTGKWVDYLDEGEQVVVEVETAATSAGAGVPWLLVELFPEMPGNNSSMVAG